MLDTLHYLMAHPIGRRTRVATLARYMAWQVCCRLRPGLHRRDWIDRTCLMVRRGMTGATGNLYVGLHEFDLTAFAMHLLRAGDCFVDVGANIGSYTVLAAGVCGASVVAFEPIPDTASGLDANIAANLLASRVQVVREAVGATSGHLQMTRSLDTTNRIVSAGASTGDTLHVPVTTLDKTLEGRAVDLLKIDVEGHELAVLQGGQDTLRRTSAVIVEVGHQAHETFATLMAAGLTPCTYDGMERRLEVLHQPASDARGNALFVRDAAQARARVAGAPRRDVMGVAL